MSDTTTERQEDLTPNYIRAFCEQTLKGVDTEKRQVTHLITNPAVDRAGDIVEPKGGDLANFMRNPVVPVDHNYSVAMIAGRSVNLTKREDGIEATTEFRRTPLGDEAMQLTAEGLGGWSIGFRSIDRHTIKQGKKQGCKRCEERWKELMKGKGEDDYVYTPGIHFETWEMLEYSIVAIPMNQEIVQSAVSRGLVAPGNVSLFFQVKSEPKPVDPADPGPKAEAAEDLDLHPVLREIALAQRSLERYEAALKIQECNK